MWLITVLVWIVSFSLWHLFLLITCILALFINLMSKMEFALDTMFLILIKLEILLYWSHFYINKLTRSNWQWLRCQCILVRESENSHPIICLCHSQTTVMVAIVFFTEVPEWQWHYDHVLDSLYLTTTSRVCLYRFFQRAFATPIFSPFFDPTAQFLGVSLYMAHPDPVPPHQAQPPIIPPHPV